MTTRDDVRALVTGTAGAALVMATGLPFLSPAASVVVGRVFDRAHASREKRVRILISHAVEGSDDAEFAVRLESALIKEDSEVAASFVRAVRAAADAIDPAVVPSIGLLFRRAFAPSLNPLPQHMLRRYLRVLEDVTASEFGDLGVLLHAVLRTPELLGEPDRSGVPVCTSHQVEAGIAVRTALLGATQHELVCVLRHPERIFDVLVENRLATAFDEDDGVLIDFDDIRALADVVSNPSTIVP